MAGTCRLRHANAHQDPKIYKRPPEIGVATPNPAKGVSKYTGQNAIAVVAQLALCTIQALSQHLGVPGQLGYLSPLRSWELAGSTLQDLPQWPRGHKPAPGDESDGLPLDQLTAGSHPFAVSDRCRPCLILGVSSIWRLAFLIALAFSSASGIRRRARSRSFGAPRLRRCWPR